MSTNDTQALTSFVRECAEIANALKSEYGAMKTHHGIEYCDFSNHVYVGRAGALLRQASALASRLQGQQGQAPEGWKLVPGEPTVEMLDAACEACDRNFGHEYLARGFGAMIAAAPSLPLAGKETAP